MQPMVPYDNFSAPKVVQAKQTELRSQRTKILLNKAVGRAMMKELIVMILLASIGLTDAGGNQDRLSCFGCGSYNSWEECGTRVEERNCQNGENRCGLLSLRSSVQQLYLKGCFKNTDCINYQHPSWCSQNAPADPHCFSNIICCEHDFCN
ncbi:uncharacterized protein LOC111337196 isoform X1 [Stylophora pistillata]|uniref:uncharacterized protein LOC111337196 isoform X1 n=1 Tax=Stylophora pistillata TaxID=50429 RepID=UPI000C03ABF5|nr:uncharacterized protein LOC111337196 isoform X1 [Stylophora pistillata]